MNEDKKYDLGLVCGRFSHEHLGHVSLFRTSLELCKHTLILVGSSQEYGTLRNPFRVETRINVIKQTFPEVSEDVLTIRGLRDLTNEWDLTHDWGKFVKNEVISHKNRFADLMISGNEDSRKTWFSPKDLEGVSEQIISRDIIPISSTLLRGMLVIDDKPAWEKVTDPLIHNMYSSLRSELMDVPIYQDIYNKIYSNNMTLDHYMKIYKELEKQDQFNKLSDIKKN